MKKMAKTIVLYTVIISLSFVIYVGYQAFYKDRTDCYMKHGVSKGLAVLAYQFQADVFSSIISFTGGLFNTHHAVVILMNEENIDKYPQYYCRVQDEIDSAKQTLRDAGSIHENRSKE